MADETIAATLAAALIGGRSQYFPDAAGVKSAVQLYRDVLNELAKAPTSRPPVQGRPIR
jgi:hypothetical protein